MIYLLIFILGGIASYFGPWWLIGPIAAIVCYFKASTNKQAFLAGSLAMSSLWAVYSLFLNYTSDVDLMQRMAGIFTGETGFLSKLPPTGFLILIMVLICSLFGGTSALAGLHLRRYFGKKIG